MFLAPFVAAAVLLRQFHWAEAVALVVIAVAFAAKDPLVVVARQRMVWRHPHPETGAARRWLGVQLPVLAVCGVVLLIRGPWDAYILLAIAALIFTGLAVMVNVQNQQRSVWFQVAGAVALMSTALMACRSVLRTVPAWGWLLWLLCALQSAAGIFVVHARLDARIAARKKEAPPLANRRAAVISVGLLALAGVSATRPAILLALLIAAIGYGFELYRQNERAELEMPLSQVGLQALGISILYVLLIIVGLW